VRQQEVHDLRDTIASLTDKLASMEAAARAAGVLAGRTDGMAGQAGSAAGQAKVTADQALAVAASAQEIAGRAAPAVPVPAVPVPAAGAAGPATASDVAAGRDLALQICANCHVVASNQWFAPRLNPPAPDFRVIANRPATSERGVSEFLLAPHGKMPDPMLAGYQVTLLVDYLMSLRGHD